jgi:hypothetical protein
MDYLLTFIEFVVFLLVFTPLAFFLALYVFNRICGTHVITCKHCGKRFQDNIFSGDFCSALCAGLFDLKSNRY